MNTTEFRVAVALIVLELAFIVVQLFCIFRGLNDVGASLRILSGR